MARDRIDVIADDDDWADKNSPFALVSRLKNWPVKDLVALSLCVIAAGAIAVNALFLQTGPHPAPIFALAPPEPPKVAPVAAAGPRAASPDATGAVTVLLPRPRPAEIAAVRPAEATRTDGQGLRPRGELISGIQRELAQRGFYDGPLDGFYGPKTDSAIRDFEQAARLRPSIEPNETLLAAIIRSTVTFGRPMPPAVIPVASRPDPLGELIAPPAKKILAVQRALSLYGYGQIHQNGILDPDTEAAIEKFERDRKLPVTGQVTDRVMRELAVVTGRPLE